MPLPGWVLTGEAPVFRHREVTRVEEVASSVSQRPVTGLVRAQWLPALEWQLGW